QPARPRQHALVSGGKALDQRKIRFGRADHVADADIFRSPAKQEPAGAAAHRLQKTRTRQRVGDLVQMRLRYIIDARGLLDGDQPVTGRGGIHQHPQRIIGKIGQPHRLSSVIGLTSSVSSPRLKAMARRKEWAMRSALSMNSRATSGGQSCDTVAWNSSS